MVLWPNDSHSDASHRVQRIPTGTNSCDPDRRTAWGTILFGEEDTWLRQLISPTRHDRRDVRPHHGGPDAPPFRLAESRRGVYALGHTRRESHPLLEDAVKHLDRRTCRSVVALFAAAIAAP